MLAIYQSIIIAITLIYGGIAIFQDFKKREVENWLNFSFIILLLAVLAFESILTSNAKPFLIGLLALGIYFGLANLFYYGRIFGGGDAKFLIGLGIAISAVESSNLAVDTLSFLVNLFFIGAIYGLVMALVFYLGCKDKKKIKEAEAKARKENKIFVLIIVIFAIIFFALSIAFKSFYLSIFALLILLLIKLIFLFKAIEECCLVKIISVSDLKEGDWIKAPVKIGNKLILPNWEGLTAKEVDIIKKAKKGKITIKEGLPFMPVLVVGFILYLFYDNFLIYLLSFFV